MSFTGIASGYLPRCRKVFRKTLHGSKLGQLSSPRTSAKAPTWACGCSGGGQTPVRWGSDTRGGQWAVRRELGFEGAGCPRETRKQRSRRRRGREGVGWNFLRTRCASDNLQVPVTTYILPYTSVHVSEYTHPGSRVYMLGFLQGWALAEQPEQRRV